jgi:hypothetical protein
MPDFVRLITVEGSEPKERDPVALMTLVLPQVPIIVGDAPTTILGAFAGKASLGGTIGPDADWNIPADVVHVVIPQLTASRAWSLPDVDGYPYGQDLVIVDEGRFLGAGLTLTLGPLAGSGDTLPPWTNNLIPLDSAGAYVRLRRGVLSNVWVTV